MVSGEIWQKENGKFEKQEDFMEDYSDLQQKFKELKEDIPVSEFINNYLHDDKYEDLRFTLENYVKGYYAADVDKASAKALCEELTTSDDEQYRVETGYQALMNYLYKEADQKGCFFYLSHPASQVNWKENEVELITTHQHFKARKVLVTVSLGVMQSGLLCFSPAIEDKIVAAKKLGFGPVIKIILGFNHIFWKTKSFTHDKDLSKLSFLFSEELIPTWWTQHPKDLPILTGWLGGPFAEALKNCTPEEILDKTLNGLTAIFDIDKNYLHQQLKGWHVINWTKDIYSNGGYAYEVVNGAVLRKKLKEPLLNTVFFAGEALYDGPEIGTVEAALVTGRETAHQIIASFQ